jgi:hypothetical protein
LFFWGAKVGQYRPIGNALPIGGNGFALRYDKKGREEFCWGHDLAFTACRFKI